MRKHNKKIAAIIALVIVVAFAIIMVAPLITQASASNEIQTKRDELEALANERKQLQAEINRVKNDRTQEMAYKDKLQSEINITQREIDTLTDVISALETQAAQKQEEIVELEAKLEQQIDKFKLRIRTMYEDGESSYLEVLLEAQTYYAFLTRMEVITSIVERDNKLIDEMNETNAQLKAAKLEIEENLKETEDAKQLVVEKREDLKAKSAASQAIINKLDEDHENYKEQFEIAEAEAQKVQNQINKLLQQQKTSEYVGGEFGWPCPGHSKITSHFGMRFHPTLRVNKLHTGMDIGAPRGASIVAANDGTVITATFNTAYGNYIVINHGGGRATLYAHMSAFSVSSGAKVTKGQQIGLVGSTGYSTGNHLHFEVIIDGVQKNPINYLK